MVRSGIGRAGRAERELRLEIELARYRAARGGVPPRAAAEGQSVEPPCRDRTPCKE